MQGLKSIQSLLYTQGDNLAIFRYNWVNMNMRQGFQLLDMLSRDRKVKVHMDFLLASLQLALKVDFKRFHYAIERVYVNNVAHFVQ